ncbi:MICOS complex subunit MIC13 [Gracilinanus agilis]|uniref:MICOS complex subunit MIC13 n=1 Tax=Gracilinanus agilis TaxID=191870 RepID=UPI001CFE1B46|nr:MICOS complex subunit MIC13 [Gracilinanus agilis]
MAPRLWPFFGFLVKAGIAGGSVYLVYDLGLLGSSSQGQAALRRAQETVPDALNRYSALFSKQTGIHIELPSIPHINLSLRDSWNSGINSLMSSLSAAPSAIQKYSHEGWNYLKGQK